MPLTNSPRKTGLTLPELGERDENGLEPMDHLFSSPEKPKGKSPKTKNGSIRKNPNATISDEEDMEVGESLSNQIKAVNEIILTYARHDPRADSSPH